MNKKNLIYSVVSILVLGAIAYIVFTIHTPYKWDPSLSPNSREPFGCELFDQLMTQSFPLGYEVMEDVPDSLDVQHDAILYSKFRLGSWSAYYDNYSQELERAAKLVDFVKRGGHVIISTSYISNWQSDSLRKTYGFPVSKNRVDGSTQYSSVSQLANEQMSKVFPKGALVWHEDRKMFKVNEMLTLSETLQSTDNRLCTPLMYEGKYQGKVTASCRKYASGGVICYVSTPLLFSNYAVMDREAVELTRCLLSPLVGHHVVRIQGRNKPAKREVLATRDEFMWLRSNPSLCHGFYLMLVTLLLALFFLSRRRMRAIPLLPKEKSMTLEFARVMGTFHYRRHDYVEVLVDQFGMLLSTLGETTVGDVERLSPEELEEIILRRTQVPKKDVHLLLTTLKQLEDANRTISQSDMMSLLDIIRNIKNQL